MHVWCHKPMQQQFLCSFFCFLSLVVGRSSTTDCVLALVPSLIVAVVVALLSVMCGMCVSLSLLFVLSAPNTDW